MFAFGALLLEPIGAQVRICWFANAFCSHLENWHKRTKSTHGIFQMRVVLRCFVEMDGMFDGSVL